jgi:hypothetical protein
MREVSYKTHWSYAGAGVKRKAPLAEFMLDIMYLMQDTGVIPPLHVLNEVLQEGGDNGGMSPGTSWRSFSIQESEYQELVEELLKLDVTEAKKMHPYIYFQKVVVDEALHQRENYLSWLQAVSIKYPHR